MSKPLPELPPLVDDPHATEIFASNASGFMAIGGTLVMTMECEKTDYSDGDLAVSRHVVARIVMPIKGAHALAKGIFDFFEANAKGKSSIQ